MGLPDGGALDAALDASEPLAVPVGLYRDQSPYLFQTVTRGVYPSSIGGSDYRADVWGPTHRDVTRGWPWRHPGGDWIDLMQIPQGPTPWASFEANAVSGATASHTYEGTDVSALVRFAQREERWLALLMRANSSRAIASPFHTSLAAPSIGVQYADGSTGVLRCRIVSAVSGSSDYPYTTYESLDLPAFLEFDRPDREVTSASLSLTVTEHWSGAATVELFLVDPPVNRNAVVAGVASRGVLDSGLAGESSVLGVHRYADGTSIDDYVVPGGIHYQNEALYDPAIFGGTPDTTKFPHTVVGKFLNPPVDPAQSTLELVDSTYRGDDFEPLAPGLGALKIVMKNQGVMAGMDNPDQSGTLGTNMVTLLPEPEFGYLSEIFVRFYVRVGAPYHRTPAERIETISGGNSRWTDMGGKWGITPDHTNTHGGNDASSGGGYGWQMRLGWGDCEADTGGPDEGFGGGSFHLYDFQLNPAGHNYGTNAREGYWGQQGGKGLIFYPGQWYCIETRLKLNSCDFRNERYLEDGALEAWVDGCLVYTKSGMVFRTAPIFDPGPTSSQMRPCRELGVKQLWMNWFHGGRSLSTADRTLFYAGLAWGKEYIGPMAGR